MGVRVVITNTNTAITRGEQQRDPASTESRHIGANAGRVGVRDRLFFITVTGRDCLRNIIL
jgi:hypothetical protein